MNYIGIDIAKHKHYVAVVDHLGEVLVKPTVFSNTQDGFNELYTLIKPYVRNRHMVGLKVTGHYGDNLVRFMLDKDCDVRIIKPITTDVFRKQRIRKTKNDAIDCHIICNVLQTGHCTKMSKHKLLMREGKQLARYHQDVTSSISSDKNQLQVCIDIVFPEFNSLFKNEVFTGLHCGFEGISFRKCHGLISSHKAS